MRIELLAPCGARIRQQNINMVCRFLDFLDESVELRHAAVVGGNGDGDRAGAFVREGVQCADGLIAGGGLAGRDVDFGATGLEESVSDGWLLAGDVDKRTGN